MALIVCEGLDRTGKTTVARYFESLGYRNIHMSAPGKNQTADSYFQDMVDIVTMAATQDIFLDRSYYGELIWPSIYGRKSLLSDEDVTYLRELEQSADTKHILMYDTEVEAHWKRCLEENEPLNKVQFTRARALYSQMASKYDFEMITLPQFLKEYPDAVKFNDSKLNLNKDNTSSIKDEASQLQDAVLLKTPEQLKLEKANAINEILSKRLLKLKGQIYDDLENEIRGFLNSKLSQLLGGTPDKTELRLSHDEIKFYKAMYARALSDKIKNI